MALQSFGEIAKHLAATATAQGLIRAADVKSLSEQEANSFMPHGAVLLGTNAKLKSARARQELGWKPSQHSIEDDIARLLKDEADRL